MKFIEPTVTHVVEDDPVKVIEKAYRICYKSEGRMGEGSESLITKLLYRENGGNIHSSPLEHRSVVICAEAWIAETVEYWQLKRATSYIDVSLVPVSCQETEGDYVELYDVKGNIRAFWDFVTDVSESDNEFIHNAQGAIVLALSKKFPAVFGPLLEVFKYAEDESIHSVEDDPQFATFHVVTTRDILQEVARNRTISPNAESTRYCNYGKLGVQFCVPYPYEWSNNVDWNTDLKQGVLNAQYKDGKAISAFEYIEKCDNFKDLFLFSCSIAESVYNKARSLGVEPQEARMILPGGLKTEMLLSGRWRDWAHFINLRNDSAAHPQMIYIANAIEQWFLDKGIEIREFDIY